MKFFSAARKTNFKSRILDFSGLFCAAGMAQWGERSLSTNVAWVLLALALRAGFSLSSPVVLSSQKSTLQIPI